LDRPANHPAASKGFRELMGETTKAVAMARGWAKARAAPIAAIEPFQRTQLKTW